jgi:hypothetical protein
MVSEAGGRARSRALLGEEPQYTIRFALIEAMVWVAMVGEDDNFVPALLKANGGIDDEALSTTNAQVGVEEDDGPLPFARVGLGVGVLLLGLLLPSGLRDSFARHRGCEESLWGWKGAEKVS